MASSWLSEDLDIDSLVITGTKAKGSNVRLLASYGDGYGYNESGYYPDYSESYSDYSNYANSYDNYSDYSNYDNYCVVHCQLKCQENQFVSHWINENFNYTDSLDYILARQYNELIDYLIKAKNYINAAVDYNHLSETFKINIDINKITVSDIYFGVNFNNINNAIQKFIDGATNISEKISYIDPILKSDMETLKIVANRIKIPNTIPITYNG